MTISIRFFLQVLPFISLFIFFSSCGKDDKKAASHGGDASNDRPSPSTVYMWTVTALADGDLGGISGAYTRCTTNAPAGLSGKTHLPVLGTSQHTPKNYFSSDPEVRRSDKTTVIISSYSDFFKATPTLTNAILTTLGGYWTGLDNSGDTDTANNCNNWESDATADSGRVGNGSATDSTRINQLTRTCNFGVQLLCVSF